MRSIHRVLLLVALALPATVLVTPPRDAAAQADPRVDARARYTSGKQKFDAGDYRGAIADFTAADQLAPSAVNDFNIALSYERLGDAAQAVRYYRSYLNRMPSAPNRADVEAAVARLDAAAKAAEADAAARKAADEEAARKAAAEAEARRIEEARKVQPPTPEPGPAPAGAPAYAPTGDPELDRVAAIDLAQARGGAALPAPAGAPAGGGAPDGAAPAPAPGSEPAPAKRPKPIYKSPVFWVVAAVGLYVLIVLASDDTSDSQPGARMLLPEGPGTMRAGSGGATLFRF